MRRVLWVVIATLSCWLAAPAQAEPVPAEPVSVDEAFADSVCGVRGGLTAISRLPPVRIVVFDPVSNSFAFIACPKEDENTISNQDFLDRHRLALTTQKIRLLVLPYNPADGNLILEKVDGEGVEFQDIVGGPLPPVRSTKGTTESTQKEPALEDTPERPEIPNEDLKGKIRPIEQRITADKSGRTLETEDSKNQSYSNLAVLEVRWQEYSRLADEVSQGLQSLRSQKRCIAASLRSAPGLLTRELAKLPHPPFSLERDVSLEEVRAEARRRQESITRDFYISCRTGSEAPADGFRSDITAYDRFASEQAVALDRLRSLSREMFLLVRRLPSTRPTEVLPEIWNIYLDSLRGFEKQVQDFNDSLAASLEEILQSADRFRAEYDRLQNARSSPAMQIQRFNYSPLGDGKSITFTIRRGEKLPDDGPAVPTRVNTLEIKSAPVHVMRFATGLVASRLHNPSYEAVAFPREDAETNTSDEQETAQQPATDNILMFDEEGNGKVLPGMFLHHYWGRRSPFLEPTRFERWTPTLSLGIPVSEAEIFSQFFLGLDWQLVPGFEINVGYHFGKVNMLEDGYQVGRALPQGVDASAVQKEKFDWDVYFGIAVNRDAFDRIFRNGED